MLKLGLIGFPIKHSLSPGLHQGFMEAFEVEGSYELFPTQLSLAKKSNCYTTVSTPIAFILRPTMKIKSELKLACSG